MVCESMQKVTDSFLAISIEKTISDHKIRGNHISAEPLLVLLDSWSSSLLLIMQVNIFMWSDICTASLCPWGLLLGWDACLSALAGSLSHFLAMSVGLSKANWFYFSLCKQRGRINRLLILTSTWGTRAPWQTSWVGGRSGSTSCTAGPVGSMSRWTAKGSLPQLKMATSLVRNWWLHLSAHLEGLSESLENTSLGYVGIRKVYTKSHEFP